MRTVFCVLVLCAMLSTIALGQEKVEVEYGGKVITIPVPKGYFSVEKGAAAFTHFQRNIGSEMELLALFLAKDPVSLKNGQCYLVSGLRFLQNRKITNEEYGQAKKSFLGALKLDADAEKFRRKAIREVNESLNKDSAEGLGVKIFKSDFIEGESFFATVVNLSYPAPNNQVDLVTGGANMFYFQERILNVYVYKKGYDLKVAKWTLKSCIALGNDIIKANPSTVQPNSKKIKLAKDKVLLDGKPVTIPAPSGFEPLAKGTPLYKQLASQFSAKAEVLGIFVPTYGFDHTAPQSLKKYCLAVQIDRSKKCDKKEFAKLSKFMQKDIYRRYGEFQMGVHGPIDQMNRKMGGKYLTLSPIKLIEKPVVEEDYFSFSWNYKLKNSKNGIQVDMHAGQGYCRINNDVLLLNKFVMEKADLQCLADDVAIWASKIVNANRVVNSKFEKISTVKDKKLMASKADTKWLGGVNKETKIDTNNTAYNIGYEFGFFMGIAILVGIPVGLILLIVWIIRKIIKRSKKVPVTEYIDNSMNIPPLPPIPNEMFSDKTNGNE